MKGQTRLLVVDDDADIRELLSAYLGRYDMEVETAGDGESLFNRLEHEPFDLIILDIMLPGEDGLSLCRRIRGQSSTPIIFLTALDSSTDRVVGLELGADDYVVKPFDPRELLARIRTVLRRVSRTLEAEAGNGVASTGGTQPRAELCRFAGWTLNVLSRELTFEDEQVTLSDALYRLLLLFLDSPFVVLSREYLLNQTQGRDPEAFDRSVDVQISRLRSMLKDTGVQKIIKTIRGGGYMLTVEVERVVL